MIDGDDRYDRVEAHALRLLAGRDRTAVELRRHLTAADHPPDEVERVITRLRQAGYLDDGRLALAAILADVAAGRAAARIDRRLLERGVEPALIERAWDAAAADHAVDRARLLAAALERRLVHVARPLDRRAIRRVYNAMLRAGFDADEVAAALEPHLPGDAG
ncbi:MAG TPA: RecX family transcriptional regulator [Candidatus Polarisedimenticolaceae bacterium]|nr:RecX family transcriptional regulator [Candidatus Polarisedimenticolaceae bacterium]